MFDLAVYAAIIVTVFALVDPIGTLPFFVALTDGFEPKDRRVVLDRAVLTMAGILTVFALVGRYLFLAFGFSLAAFEVAGGIILFLVAYDMLRGEVTRTKLTPGSDDSGRRYEVGIVPLGIPLLAGPGAISTVMIYEGTAGSNPIELSATFVAIAVSAFATWITFRYGAAILDRLGRVGVVALSRVLGLILAAIGVQFVITGILAVIVSFKVA
jgi:multiple antibiotic resistance protein